MLLITILSAEIEDIFLIRQLQAENVSSISYLGANIGIDGVTDEDIKQRIIKSQNCFRSLIKIWNSKNITRRIKINIFKSTVKAVPLYGSEAWKFTKLSENKLNVFQTKCLRKIYQIFWPKTISNDELFLNTDPWIFQKKLKYADSGLLDMF